MYFFARYSIAITAVFSLAACVPTNIGANYSLAKAKASNHGLLVGSMSVESLDELQPVQFTILFNDEPERGGGQNQVDVFSGCNMRHFGEVSFGDGCGKIVAFDLPAGTYYITFWDLFPGSDIAQSPAHWDAVPFTIEPGRATYVGNIHLVRRSNVTDANGSHPISRIWPVVTDRSQRDISILEQLYPGLRPDLIDDRPLQFPAPGDVNTAYIGAAFIPVPTKNN